jgi:hypothetical protein
VDLKPCEIPHKAALRSLEEHLGYHAVADHLLRIQSNRGSFISPVQVEAFDESSLKHITFSYVYLLPERIPIPDGWKWRPRDSVLNPGIARQIIREMSE